MVAVRHIDIGVADHPVCDFCSSDEPRYVESCEDFDVYFAINELGAPEIGTAKGGWSACEVCHQLIREQKWHTLERRAVDAICAKHPAFPKSKVREGVQHMHGQFRLHRPAA